MSVIRLLLLSVFASIAFASEDCIRPEAPASVPDGATAGVEEMMTANATVTQFVGDGTIYTDCLQPHIDEAKARAKKSKDKAEKTAAGARAAELIRLHDSMVDEMEAIANAFNLSVKAFNAREL